MRFGHSNSLAEGSGRLFVTSCDQPGKLLDFTSIIERRTFVKSSAMRKPGDIWILGDHRVGCGDGRDAGFLQRVIGDGARVDAAFLDPPYNVRIGGHAVAAGSHREFAMASGEMSEAEFRSFLSDTLGTAARSSREGAVHFVAWTGDIWTASRRSAPPFMASA